MTKLESRTEAYRFLYKKKRGKFSEIKANNVGEDLFRELCSVGYIKNGMNGDWEERWSLTSYGERQIKKEIEFHKKIEERDNFLGQLRKQRQQA